MTNMMQRTALDLPVEEWKTYRPIPAILQRQSATQSQLERRRIPPEKLFQPISDACPPLLLPAFFIIVLVAESPRDKSIDKVLVKI